MAREVIERSVCDFCEETGVETYTVSGPTGETVVVDVCEEHAGPFREAMSVGSSGPRQRRKTTERAKPVHHTVQPFDWKPEA